MNINAADTIRQIGRNTKIRDKYVVDDCISKSPYDQTYIGVVVDKVYELPTVVSAAIENDAVETGRVISQWIVTGGGYTFIIERGRSNITSIGQRVRVYIPSNMKNCVYAEVINPATTPDEAIYLENDSRYKKYKEYGIDEKKGITDDNYNDKVIVDSITERWILANNEVLQRLYLLTVINGGKENEEVTNIICPDGKVMKLEGFFVHRWGYYHGIDNYELDNSNN